MEEAQKNIALMRVKEIFNVNSGDFHAIKELDPGNTPLISCGDGDNGCIGYFDIPTQRLYSRAITVAYNGQPLTVKFHPYKFGAKDDVAVLTPLAEMQDATLLYFASALNRMQWRYSYGRKCFRQKLAQVMLQVPVEKIGKQIHIDEDAIRHLLPKGVNQYLPSKQPQVNPPAGASHWKPISITTLLSLKRGDFHSLSALNIGDYMTVSRVTTDNGVVGYFERPDGAEVYESGCLTISTVGGDAFVQMDKFIATDNVIVCTPKKPLRQTTLFFIAFMLNHQKWRYGYGRQCY